jgi:hypothetical protein
VRLEDHKPLLCMIDFDGCVNVLHPAPALGNVFAELDGYVLQANPVVLAGLDQVIRDLWLKPVWASAWGKRAPHAGRLLGIGADWPALEFVYPDQDGRSAAFLTDGLDGVAEYKHPLIRAQVGDEPFIWIDDDITPRLERWAARRDRRIPTLVIRPNPRIGLTMTHLEKIVRFAFRVREWRGGSSTNSTSPSAA